VCSAACDDDATDNDADDVLADARIQTVEMSAVTAFTTFTGLKAAPQVRLNRDPSAARPRLQGLRVLDRFFLRQLS
jgi:hypothetical protein